MKALFTSFPTSDNSFSKRFYKEAAGLTIIREFDGKPHLFIETDSLDSTVEKIRNWGGKATEIKVYFWGGRCTFVTDPFGNIFSLNRFKTEG